jgi:hypothetical protein
MKHVNTVLANAVFLDVKAGGIYSSNCSLKAELLISYFLWFAAFIQSDVGILHTVFQGLHYTVQ